jgi:hypothetical protein
MCDVWWMVGGGWWVVGGEWCAVVVVVFFFGFGWGVCDGGRLVIMLVNVPIWGNKRVNKAILFLKYKFCF